MSRPPVICLKKEEPRSRYVRREVLSVFETFMNFRDPPQAGSVFFCECSQPRRSTPLPSDCGGRISVVTAGTHGRKAASTVGMRKPPDRSKAAVSARSDTDTSFCDKSGNPVAFQ